MGRPYLEKEEFIRRVNDFGYSFRNDFIYTGTRGRYDVICPKHPEYRWVSLGSNLLSGHGCKLCRDENQVADRTLSEDDVLSRLKLDGRGIKIRTGFRYINCKTAIPMVCPNHPEYNWIIRPLEAIKGKGCPQCVGHAPLSNEEIDKRITPRNIRRLSEYSGLSHSVMDFECLVDGHRWPAQVHKVAGVNYTSGCPKCTNTVRWTHEAVDTWLSANIPTIERTTEFKTVQAQTGFKCKIDGYEWDDQFGNVRKGYGCPCCRKTKYWNTELVSMWLKANKPHLSLVGEFTKSNQYSRFKCERHDLEFDRRFSYILKGYDCPDCSGGGGFKKTMKGYLYYAKIFVGGDEFYKIGITNRQPEVRIAETKHCFEILASYEFVDGDIADRVESAILKQFSDSVQQNHKFSGSTECFTKDIRNHINLDEFVSTFKE